jgi:hypothetical protein
MTDPFLLSHIVRPLHFDIGGNISPVSIRDQMIRGRVIIDRAYQQGLIDLDRWLLVIGAGAAGVTAAIQGASYGVTTILIEQNPFPFGRQSLCRTRWICPTQYDWPIDHWLKGQFPWPGAGPPMPLPWSADYSNLLAALWNRELNVARSSYKNLTLLSNTVVDRSMCEPDGAFKVKNDLLEVHLIPYGGRYEFGMALSCVGPGEERHKVNDYAGFQFWETDPFEEPNFGLDIEEPRALISGGGDGALQDFLRAVTKKKSADDIYRGLLPYEFKGEIENRILSIEDQAKRSHLWSGTRQHDHEILSAIYELYQDLIDNLSHDHRIWPRIVEKIDDIMDGSPDELNVKLVYPCRHFSKCYGLNQFLVLLIAKYLKMKYNHYPLQSNTVVLDVRGNDHTCQGNPAACHGKEHKVELGNADCDTMDRYLRGQLVIIHNSAENYDVVIIRHGVKPPSYTFGAQQIANVRHALPYYVPWR